MWDAEGLFQRTLAETRGGQPFVFFEGPPTANGRPGIHHVFSRTIKDLFCRYRSMRGFAVSRKAGWDAHGLPVEIEVEKQLGISGKHEIEAIGIAEFNRLCRESVFTYRGDWERLSWRIGYWLDYANPYVTYSNEYIESVWWALRTLFDRGLLYRGHKILPYCPRCGTVLSSHEVAQGYEDVEDPSVYLALDVTSASNRRILVWTTTPWTLLSNAALAVHPDLDYVEVIRRDGRDPRTLIVAEERLSGVFGPDFGDRWEIVGRFTGREMVGWTYRRPLDWLEYPAGFAHEIVVAEEFVSADEGTGVVHMSPAFGADDYAAGQRHNLAFLQPVGTRGEFPASVPVVGGLFVKDADPLLIEELKRRGVLWKSARLKHAYPHCWRCGTPLLYYARTSWFVRTTMYRDAMLGRNARVSWHPREVGEGRFGEWLTNNVDWAVSRERYWGTTLPIWVCDADETHLDVLGGFDELAERSGSPLPCDFDPHRPGVDRYAWACRHAACQGTMRRVPEVLDTWFDSGSMPFAQWHFPFEGDAALGNRFPADFIAEGIDQTRGWFYSLLAIATGLGDALPNNGLGSPYRAVVVNDLVLDADGRKMSKSRGNVVDPWQVIEQYGADAVRIFLIASSDVSVPRRFDERAIRELSVRFLLTLRNVYSGIFAQYANFGWGPSDRDPPPEARPALDRWMLAQLTQLERTVDRALDAYDATAATRAIIRFVEDDVANWYVRLSRARFYDVEGFENRSAFSTLHEVLVSICRVMAPVAPFMTDWIHRELVGGSVHVAPLSNANGRPADATLDAAMRATRELARLGRAAREEVGMKVRQPLSRMVCVAPRVPQHAMELLAPLLCTELNVKRVEFASTADALVSLEAKPNFRSLGKRFGKKTPLAAAAIQAFTPAHLLAFERGEPLLITVEGESHQIAPEDLIVLKRASGSLAIQEEGGFFAAIDPTVTPELRLEGLARELVSCVQRMRREAGFAVSNRISLRVAGGSELCDAVREHHDWIAAETLAVELVVVPDGLQELQEMQAHDLNGVDARVSVTRIA